MALVQEAADGDAGHGCSFGWDLGAQGGEITGAGFDPHRRAIRRRRHGCAMRTRRQPFATPAVASTASASTRIPASAHSGVMLSASLWLKPPWQGQKIMVVGTWRAT